MKTIRIEFMSDGEPVRLTAILTDDLLDLSKSKKNQATDICDYPSEGYWSIIFECADATYEVEFKYDEDYPRTLKPRHCLTWESDPDGVLLDSQYCTSISIK